MIDHIKKLVFTKSFWAGVIKLVLAAFAGSGTIPGLQVELDADQAKYFDIAMSAFAWIMGLWGADTINKRSTEIRKEIKRERGLIR